MRADKRRTNRSGVVKGAFTRRAEKRARAAISMVVRRMQRRACMSALARRPPISLATPRPMPVSQVVPTYAKPSVLLVDPDPGYRAELAAVLEEAFEVHEAADGATAMQLAAMILPSVIISELDLPVVNGFELARAFKSNAGPLRHIPLVFLSSRTAPREVAHAIAAGARRFLLKPCAPRTVVDIVRRMVNA